MSLVHPRSLARRAAFALALAAAAAAPRAFAQTSGEKAAAAQALFDEAMRLTRAGQIAEACPKLEESLRLDTGMATQFRLAECYEKLGKIASAWASFVAVADSAAVARLPDREAAARKRAEALVARIPRLTISVPAAVAALDGVEVQRDGVAVGKPLWGVPIPVDPGEHVVTARAPGKKVWEGRLTAAEETPVLTLAVEPLHDVPTTTVTPPPPHRARSAVPAIVLGGVAAVGVGVGAALFAVHSGRQSSAETLSATIKSGGGSCAPPVVDARCASLAGSASSSDTFGNVSTVAFAAGGAAAVAMVTYLVWPTAPAAPVTMGGTPKPPASALRLAPILGGAPGGGTRGIAVTGSF